MCFCSYKQMSFLGKANIYLCVLKNNVTQKVLKMVLNTSIHSLHEWKHSRKKISGSLWVYISVMPSVFPFERKQLKLTYKAHPFATSFDLPFVQLVQLISCEYAAQSSPSPHTHTHTCRHTHIQSFPHRQRVLCPEQVPKQLMEAEGERQGL